MVNINTVKPPLKLHLTTMAPFFAGLGPYNHSWVNLSTRATIPYPQDGHIHNSIELLMKTATQHL